MITIDSFITMMNTPEYVQHSAHAIAGLYFQCSVVLRVLAMSARPARLKMHSMFFLFLMYCPSYGPQVYSGGAMLSSSMMKDVGYYLINLVLLSLSRYAAALIRKFFSSSLVR